MGDGRWAVFCIGRSQRSAVKSKAVAALAAAAAFDPSIKTGSRR
jgi:hypothetical protein